MIIAQKRPASRAVRRSYTVIQNEKFSFRNLNYIRSEIINYSTVWLLDEWIEKLWKKTTAAFLKSTLSVLRWTWTGRINLKIFLGHHINYLSIWPFMCHPWFPTRKASKLTFICFQHQVLNTLQGLDNWSWKQINVSFEAFLVGDQGWHIKGQMLR